MNDGSGQKVTRVMEQERTILVVDDDHGQRELLQVFLVSKGFRVVTASSAEEALLTLDRQPTSLLVSDVRMTGMSGLELLRIVRERRPDLPVLLVTAYADVRDAVGAMRDGAVNYLQKPIDFEELLSCVLTSLAVPTTVPPTSDRHPALPQGVVFVSQAMQMMLDEVAIVAPTDSRVLVTGESGTGKEVLADLIHAWSRRTDRSIVKVNCAALPGNLLESELFGHERGAFTGAVERRLGRFEEADGGTVFLDEIAEMTPELQAKLLRVIQDGSFQRLGSNELLRTDVRIIAATNRNLDQEVAEGRFRDDLFYRLNVIEFYIPPLRERPEDILPLAERFATVFGHARTRLSAGVVAKLMTYSWPGNVRELRNAMERASLMARGGSIMPEHLPSRIRDAGEYPKANEPSGTSGIGRIEEVERAVILQTLEECAYNRTDTARALGISRRALIYKLQRLKEQGFRVDAGN